MASYRISFFRISIAGILLLAWIAVATAQSADLKPKPNSSISGRVTIDDKAAAGIPVAAVAGESINRRDASARAVSDVEGHYRISGLAPGQYQVWTLTPGMIAQPGTAPNYYSYNGSVKSVILVANEDVSDIDLKLIRGGVITGRITNTENKPIVDERVALQLLDANGAPRIGALGLTNDQMYVTDDRGVYRIFGLPPGRYKVSIGSDANEGIRRGPRYQKTFYPDANDQSKATIVELKEGDEANNIDIKVQAASPGFVASGRVIDAASGLPNAKAGVRFKLVQKVVGPGAASFGIQADDRGEFNFSGFSPGRYEVMATSQVYGGNFYSDPVLFDVVDKDVTGIEIKTTPGLSLSGVVAVDGMSMKDLLTLVPTLKVAANGLSSSGNEFTSGGNSAIAPDGSFQIDGLRPGRVSLYVSTSAGATARPTIARIEHDGIGLNQGFDIQQSVFGLRVVVNFGTGVIRGTVKFEGDLSLGDTMIYVSCVREGAREPAVAMADARGHFLIRNLSPGKHECSVQPRIRTPTPLPRIPPQVVEVSNGAESEVTFVVDVRPTPGGP